MRDSLGIDSYAHIDKEVLARLLKLVEDDAHASGQLGNLDTNEELLRLIPVLCAFFSRDELLRLVGERLTEQMLELHRLEVVQNLFLERELQRVLRAFNRANIPLMLIKGPVLAHTIYPETHRRTYHDIDAFIRQEDLARAHDLLGEMGFSFYEEFRANAIDRKRTGYNYVLDFPDSWLKAFIELHSAPHAGEIDANFDVEVLWSRAQSIMVLGEPTVTLSTVDHLLYLCWHYRFHGFTRLLWLYDIVAMVRAGDPGLDWEQLVSLAQRQRLATTLYYCLSWCRDIFGVTVPDEILARLRPPWLCRLIVERLVLSDPFEALALPRWRTRRILAHRAMVDSAGELLRAGLRALFPAPAVLGRRYLSRSRLPLQIVFMYYLVHPWITLVKGCRYLMKGGRGPRLKGGPIGL